MKKLTSLSLLSLVTINFLLADEYISDAYFEEIMTQSEVIYESIDDLPITQTIEEQNRETQAIAEESLEVSENQVPVEELIEEESAPLLVSEEKQSIQVLTYENVLKQARDEGKTIMLSIRSTNCKYCDRMEEGTLRDESVKEALANDFLTIHYNQDLDTLPLNLQNGATPIFIFVNTNEDIIQQYPGVRTPAQFKEMLKEILAK